MSAVGVVIVSLNTRELLRACLEALLASVDVQLEIIVVDNASDDGSADMVAEVFPEVTLIRSERNVGFAAANNLGLRRTAAQYVLLLNPDTLVPPECVAHLVAFLRDHHDAGMCGPMVLSGDGSLQSCGSSFPSLLSELRESSHLPTVLRLVVGQPPPAPVPMKPMIVDWVSGCCLLVRREVFERIGLLDEQYFLYSEELDWCYNARRHGWHTAVVPTTSIVHYGGQSSSQVADAALAWLVESRLRYYRKNRGLTMAGLVAAAYLVAVAVRWSAEPRKASARYVGVRKWMAGLTRSYVAHSS